MSRSWCLALLVLVVSGCAAGPPLDRISAACPLLLASPEATMFLEPGLVPVEHNLGNDALFSCDFKRGRDTVLGLTVSEFPARGRTPAALIASTVRRNRAQSTSVAGVGQAAAYSENSESNFGVLVAAKRSGVNLRMILIGAVKPFSVVRLAALARVALDRI